MVVEMENGVAGKGGGLVSDRLPELDEEEVDLALDKESVEWAGQMVKWYIPGAVHRLYDFGVTIQIIGSEEVRCIAVFDDQRCYLFLSMLRMTFEAAGVVMAIDPFAVVSPPREKPAEGPPFTRGEDIVAEDPPPTPSDYSHFGMEVV